MTSKPLETRVVTTDDFMTDFSDGKALMLKTSGVAVALYKHDRQSVLGALAPADLAGGYWLFSKVEGLFPPKETHAAVVGNNAEHSAMIRELSDFLGSHGYKVRQMPLQETIGEVKEFILKPNGQLELNNVSVHARIGLYLG